jgi:hypothetical protein
MASLSADFPTPFSKIGPLYLHPSHRITGRGLLSITPTVMARAFPPTEPPQHRIPADSSRFPKTPPLSADWGSATAVDISVPGASVRTKLALVPREWLKVAVTGEISHAVAALVAWVREDESSHSTLAGLEFLNTPAASNGPEIKSVGNSGDLADAHKETTFADCCPKCTSTSYRASRRRWYERLMKRPKMARCSNCHHRFPYPIKRI